MPTQPSVLDVVQKLQAQLKSTGWYEPLRLHLGSGDFTDIIEWLNQEREANRRFTPPLKYLLRPFVECPLDKLQVVLLVGSPVHPGLNEADGLALSSTETPLPYATYQLVKAVQSQQGKEKLPSGDLTRWAQQGVLLLHRDLTTQLDRAGHPLTPHPWSSFHHALLDVLSHRLADVPLIFHDFPTDYEDEFDWRANTFFTSNFLELALVLETLNESVLTSPISW